MGDGCARPCPGGLYGEGCSKTCDCRNDAACDPINGRCICLAGYKGLHCEDSKYLIGPPKKLTIVVFIYFIAVSLFAYRSKNCIDRFYQSKYLKGKGKIHGSCSCIHILCSSHLLICQRKIN